MKKLLLIILFIFLSFFLAPQARGQQRYAVCDRCGYCVPQAPAPSSLPESWENCRQCIYPSVNPDPALKQTLLIPSITDAPQMPPTPYPGRYYTMLGCVRSSVDPLDFMQKDIARSLTDVLLSLIFSAVGALAFLTLLYGAFLLSTSQADPQRLGYGKRVVYGAIVGLVFSLLSVFIIRLLATGVLNIPFFQSPP